MLESELVRACESLFRGLGLRRGGAYQGLYQGPASSRLSRHSRKSKPISAVKYNFIFSSIQGGYT